MPPLGIEGGRKREPTKSFFFFFCPDEILLEGERKIWTLPLFGDRSHQRRVWLANHHFTISVGAGLGWQMGDSQKMAQLGLYHNCVHWIYPPISTKNRIMAAREREKEGARREIRAQGSKNFRIVWGESALSSWGIKFGSSYERMYRSVVEAFFPPAHNNVKKSAIRQSRKIHREREKLALCRNKT